MVSECDKKGPSLIKKHFSEFKKQAIDFQKHLLKLLETRELDIKATLLIISKNNQGTLKNRENTKMIKNISI